MQLDSHDPSRLSERERQVLQLLARGLTNKEIANALTLSVRTVEHHRASVLAKLRARGRAELVEHAARRGWVLNRTIFLLVGVWVI